MPHLTPTLKQACNKWLMHCGIDQAYCVVNHHNVRILNHIPCSTSSHFYLQFKYMLWWCTCMIIMCSWIFLCVWLKYMSNEFFSVLNICTFLRDWSGPWLLQWSFIFQKFFKFQSSSQKSLHKTYPVMIEMYLGWSLQSMGFPVSWTTKMAATTWHRLT